MLNSRMGTRQQLRCHEQRTARAPGALFAVYARSCHQGRPRRRPSAWGAFCGLRTVLPLGPALSPPERLGRCLWFTHCLAIKVGPLAARAPGAMFAVYALSCYWGRPCRRPSAWGAVCGLLTVLPSEPALSPPERLGRCLRFTHCLASGAGLVAALAPGALFAVYALSCHLGPALSPPERLGRGLRFTHCLAIGGRPCRRPSAEGRR